MNEPITKSDLKDLKESLQENLRGEIRASEARLGTKIDEVDQRLGTKIDEVDQRLGTKIDQVEQRLGTKIDQVEQRLGSKIDEVDQRLTAQIHEVDGRLDAKMDEGFGMVAAQFVETEARLKRHADAHFDALREDIRKVAEGVAAANERLDRHIQQNDREHARLERACLVGDAALDRRVTALEKRVGEQAG